MIYLICFCSLVIEIIIFSFIYLKLIRKSLSILTASITEIVSTDFEKPLISKNWNSISEINNLAAEFNNLVYRLKKKEDELQIFYNDFLESEIKYENLSNLLPESIFEVDNNGILTYLKIQKAKAEESDKLKSAFLENISHELLTPMNAIIGFSEMLKDSEINQEERNEFISVINENSESLFKLIKDIVDIAKIESGQISINKTDTNIHKMGFELLSSVNKMNKRNIKIIYLNEDDLFDQIVVTDQQRLKQVLLNLLSNAIKFTDEGFIRLGFKISDDKRKVIFLVQDSGIGIPLDKQEVIFEKFTKIIDNQKEFKQGTGLGLYITKRILNLIGGEIWMDSIPGIGSNFYVSIPFEKSKIKPSIEISNSFYNHINFPEIKNIGVRGQERQLYEN
jgi:signal transduction histidine kinase